MPEGGPLRADAVVIGTGAGGGPAAAVLAEAGLEVLVLEAGPRFETRDFPGDGDLGRLMQAATASGGGLQLYAGRCVGGSTVVNDALCWRPPPEILEEWRRNHGLAGLTDAALAPHVEHAWQEVHASPTDRAHLNRNAHRLEVGAARLGWAAEAVPRSVRGCANLGLCNLGCPTGAKQSALLTWIPRAERAGARVLPSTRALRIEARGGAVQAVECERLDPQSGRPVGVLRVATPRVVAAAGVLGTPALLLRSGWPAGQGVQLHSSVHVAARFREPVHGYYGPTMSYAVSEFADVLGRAGPGFMIENVTSDPVTTASALPGFGEDHARAMAALPYLARALVVLRDRTRGRVELGDDGEARLHYAPERSDLERLRAGIDAIARLFLASGALKVYLPAEASAPVRRESELAASGSAPWDAHALTLLYAVHLFGGAAMAGSADAGFCDEGGAAFGVRGLWVSDASALPGNTGVNPQITIMANALRVAHEVAARGTPS